MLLNCEHMPVAIILRITAPPTVAEVLQGPDEMS